MTSTVTIKKEVRDLENAIMPRLPWSFVVCWPWNIEEPHGRYRYQRVVVENYRISRYEAVDLEQQRALMRAHYECISKYAKRLQNGPGECGVDWRTFDTYQKGHECRCGNFGHVEESIH